MVLILKYLFLTEAEIREGRTFGSLFEVPPLNPPQKSKPANPDKAETDVSSQKSHNDDEAFPVVQAVPAAVVAQTSGNLIQQSSNLVRQNTDVNINPKFLRHEPAAIVQQSSPIPVQQNFVAGNQVQQIANTVPNNFPSGQNVHSVPEKLKKFHDEDSAFLPPAFDPDFDSVRTGFKVINTPTEFTNPVFRAPRNLQFGFKPMTTPLPTVAPAPAPNFFQGPMLQNNFCHN